jgi:DNA-binding response OmpR family regulator
MDKSYHILVVDDDFCISDIIKNMLEDEGFQVTVAPDGRSALDVYKIIGADLILLDIKMPGMNGYKVLEQLRRESQVPVIVLTGLCDTEAVTRMIDMGANDYVIKPFQDRELMARVRAKIEHPRISKN